MAMKQKRPKSFWRYWTCRLYAIGMYFGFLPCLAFALVTKNERLLKLSFLCVPFLMPAGVLFVGWMRFPFAYSAFGKRRRTPLPEESPIYVAENSYGTLGRLRLSAPLVSWLIYSTGVGAHIVLFGDVFLPWEAIDSLEHPNSPSATLYHHSAEVRHPIRLPMEVAQRIAQMLRQRRAANDVVTAELLD